MLGVMKDKRQLLKENTHSSKDTEEQTTCSLKHNWKVASPLHLLSQAGGCMGNCCSLHFLLTLCLGADERLFSSQRWGKKPPILKPTVIHQLFLHCFEEGHICIQLKSVVTDPGWRTDSIPGPNSGQPSLLSVSPCGGCWKLVIWYIPKIPLNRRKQSKPSTISQGGKAISSSSCKTGADWKVSGKVIIAFDESIRKLRLARWCE